MSLKVRPFICVLKRVNGRTPWLPRVLRLWLLPLMPNQELPIKLLDKGAANWSPGCRASAACPSCGPMRVPLQGGNAGCDRAREHRTPHGTDLICDLAGGKAPSVTHFRLLHTAYRPLFERLTSCSSNGVADRFTGSRRMQMRAVAQASSSTSIG